MPKFSFSQKKRMQIDFNFPQMQRDFDKTPVAFPLKTKISTCFAVFDFDTKLIDETKVHVAMTDVDKVGSSHTTMMMENSTYKFLIQLMHIKYCTREGEWVRPRSHFHITITSI